MQQWRNDWRDTCRVSPFAGICTCPGAVDFSVAQALMGTFKTFAIYAGAASCLSLVDLFFAKASVCFVSQDSC
jgi:hypothetical protein